MIKVTDDPTLKKVKCKECGAEFEQKVTVRFPRKFCKECSEQRKKDYDDLWKVKAEDCEDA